MPINKNLPWTSDLIEELRKFAETRASAARAAAKFKRSKASVISIAQRHGIKFVSPQRLPPSERQKFG